MISIDAINTPGTTKFSAFTPGDCDLIFDAVKRLRDSGHAILVDETFGRRDRRLEEVRVFHYISCTHKDCRRTR